MITGIAGKLSGGKTAFGVKLAHDKFLKGKKVISNIRLNFGDIKKVKYISNEDFVILLKQHYHDENMLNEIFFNSVLFIDEVVFLLNARSRGGLNELITGFLMMVGKLNCDVIFTAQLMESQADVRLREITNVYCNCYRLNQYGQPLIFEDRIINEKILILVDMEIDLDIRGKRRFSFVFDPEKYFPMYSTREINMLDRSQFLSGGKRDLKKW